MPDNKEARLHLAMLLARMGSRDEARAEAMHARELAPKDGYTAFHAASVHAIVGDLSEAIESLKAAQSRGYFIESELVRNTDLDVLRGLPEFKALGELVTREQRRDAGAASPACRRAARDRSRCAACRITAPKPCVHVYSTSRRG